MSAPLDASFYRNIGIMAHIDAGKTTTTERFLYFTKKIHKVGEVHEGNTTTDWMLQEQERGITITAAAISCFWKQHQITIIDTPGHVDFTIEVERSLRVLDGAIAVFDAVAGVEPQSEKVWYQADHYHIPRIAFINKMDRVGADFDKSFQSIVDKLNQNALMFQRPVFHDDDFVGIIDLFSMKSILWDDNLINHSFIVEEISADYHEEAQYYRQVLIERLIEFDDSLMEKYLDNYEISIDDLKIIARKATLQSKITPVFCGSAFKNKGVQPLLDALIEYLPSPLDTSSVEGMKVDLSNDKVIRLCRDSEPFSAFVFKLTNDSFVGHLVFIRIYSGQLQIGDIVYHSRTGKKVRIQKILRMQADQRESLENAKAGDICAIVGPKFIATGDSFSDPKHPICFENFVFPQPVISIAVEAKTKAETEKLLEVFHSLMIEDPTFRGYEDSNTGQIIMQGMGELHLEIIADRLKREFSLDVNLGKPEVTFRESITKTVIEEIEFSREIGGKNQSAYVKLQLSPVQQIEEKKEISFVNALENASSFSDTVISAVYESVKGTLQSGPLQGYPVIDIEVTLVDLRFEEKTSDLIAVQIAAAMNIRKALEKSVPVLLEPIMRIEVISPKDYVSNIVADFNSRSAKIDNILPSQYYQTIQALAPLSKMFGYSTKLRSFSQGRATYSMLFSHYASIKTAKKKQEGI